MTVFKAFLKVLKQCKIPVIIYSVMLIVFGVLNMKTSDSTVSFTASKPDVLIINNDKDSIISAALTEYMAENCNLITDIQDSEDAVNDALFYRNVNYVIYIPDNFGNDILSGLDPTIEIKASGDYQSSYAELLLSRYIGTLKVYSEFSGDEQQIADRVKATLSVQTDVEVTSSLDTNAVSKATLYYNFASYSMLAGCIYVISLIMSSFKSENIIKRTAVSSMSMTRLNRQLLLSNSLFAVALWLIYVLLSFAVAGETMTSAHGAVFIVNSFIFTVCALTIAFLIGNIVTNKNAINGIVNVVALGSAFLCGAFVPPEWLPDTVLKIAHVLPSYWFINTNQLLKETETINAESLKPVIFNMVMLLVFALIFTVTAVIASKNKRSDH